MIFLKKLIIVVFLSLMTLSCSHTPQRENAPFSPPTPKPIKNVNLAIVLSGGGARAVAQAGVIDVLSKNNIPIDLIVGSSAGSVIGAMYADDPNGDHLRSKIITLHKWDILDWSWSSGLKMFWYLTGPVNGKKLKSFIKKKIKATDFAELKIPLVVVTTDINTGEAFIIRSGPLAPALHASSAIPMLFTPVNLYGKMLVDGGVVSPVPVEVAKSFSPKIIIAVDIGTTPNNGKVNSVFQIGYRSLHVSYYQLSQWQTKQADIVIHPDIDKFSMFTDKDNEAMFRAGREAAIKALPQIRAALAKIE